MIIVNDLLYSGFRLAGVLRGPMRGLSASEQQEGLNVLGSLLDSWSTERLCQFHIIDLQTNLAAKGQQSPYTIGVDPTGAVIADIDVPRPAHITNANIITQNGTAQPTRIPLDILNKDGWSSVRSPNVGSSIPQEIYDDYDSPLSLLYLYPFPNVVVTLELFYWAGLQMFEDVESTVTFPYGYQMALEYALGCMIADRFPGFKTSANLERRAREAKQKLMALNAPDPISQCDEALLGGKKSLFNYLTGDTI